MTPAGPQNEPKTDAIDRAVRIGQFIDLYGPLLTDRQREFLKLHFEDDLSFGEIAREYGVSRQAVHDAVKHAENALETYDAKLGFSLDKLPNRRSSASEADNPKAVRVPQQTLEVKGLSPCIDALEEIHERLKRSGGVIYNADGITRDLADVLARLRQLDGGN